MRALWTENSRVFNNCFIKYKPLSIWAKNDFFELLLLRKLKLSFIREYIWSDLAAPYKQVWSLGFVCTTAALCNIFSCFWFLKMEISSLLDLLNSWFTSIEKGLFCGEEHRKRKYALFDSRLPWIRWQCFPLVYQPYYFVKHCSSSSTYSLNCWTYFPKDCWVILKQGKMLNFLLRFEFQLLTNFSECFAIRSWKSFCSRYFLVVLFSNLSSCTAFYVISILFYLSDAILIMSLFIL